nr:hypothetical protein [Endozoicomonas sp.]
MNLYSWLDVERLLAANSQNFTSFPTDIADIRAFSEAIEIDLKGEDETVAFDFLNSIFANNWQRQEKRIQLAYGAESYIEVDITTRCEEQAQRSLKPLWKDLGYDAGKSSLLPIGPTPFSGKCKIAAFHSFKGGVGRTTSLLTWFKALQANFHSSENKHKKLKVLLVDADLEAPGLTYLFKSADKPGVSWIQLLEASHYPPVDESEVVDYFSEEINRFTKNDAGFEYCLLPAFSESEKLGMGQLMDISVRPEHLTRAFEQPWRCTDILQKLGEKLSADIILIDLRAGLSELSSPLLFDPRVERFIVTTLSEQAIKGTEFILNRLASMANNQRWRSLFGSDTLDPRVITTFITEEFKKTDQYQEGLERLSAAYMIDKNPTDNVNATDGLEIIEGEFSSQMLNLGSLDRALHVIEYANPLLTEALNWAKDFSGEDSISAQENADDSAGNLYDLCNKLVYAEKGATEKLLLTEPLRNLARRHTKSLPQVVSIGAKGAGKTFNYIQLCRRGIWSNFLDEAQVTFSKELSEQLENTYILPHISSINTEEEAETVINDARATFYGKIQATTGQGFSQTRFTQGLKTAMGKPDTDWMSFWEKSIVDLHGFDGSVSDFESLSSSLDSKGLQTIILFDGLEDLFQNVGENAVQTSAIQSLLNIPNRLREVRSCRVGIIILIREDYVEAVTSQNHGQFVARYEPYQLAWDAEAFLRLVYWTCEQAGLALATETVSNLTARDISAKLHSLWGVKLGKPSSREAYSVRWVYAALCDLKGRLQARDIVRFLKYSSERTRDSGNKGQWPDRVLMPQSMRDAMAVCSEEKVSEAKNELAVLKHWIDQLDKVDASFKVIPFSAKDIELNP